MKQQELIPFNLERALAGDKVLYGDEIISKEDIFVSIEKDTEFPILVEDGGNGFIRFTIDGISQYDQPVNLFMAPKEPVVCCTHYMNIYKFGRHFIQQSVEACKEAIRGLAPFPIAIQETKIYDNGDVEVSIVHKY